MRAFALFFPVLARNSESFLSVGGPSSDSPMAISTIAFANWFVSRGRFGLVGISHQVQYGEDIMPRKATPKKAAAPRKASAKKPAPKPKAKKETSDRMAALASKALRGEKLTKAEIAALGGSVLSQDETPGRRRPGS